MSSPAEDKDLEEYLRRKSALSMGYKKLYVEAPPPELDRAITARARRALRWIVPGIISAAIAVSLVVGVNVGIGKFMTVGVEAERNALKIRKERAEQLERERLSQPIPVIIDARNIAKIEAEEAAKKLKAEQAARAEWLAKIEALKRDGKLKDADAELRKLQAAYPEPSKQ